MTRSSEPIFNVPAVVLAFLAVFVLVRLGEAYLLTEGQDLEFLIYFGFIPGRYDPAVLAHTIIPGGIGASIWTFVTYAFLHGDALHLTMNAVWFLPFAAAVARRFGTLRFIGFFIVTAVAGAATHLATHFGELLPMIGASAAVSGFMAGAIRFAFQRGGPVSMLRSDDLSAYQVPAAPLRVALRDRRILFFLAIWFGLNIVFGIGAFAIPGEEGQSIAWQAHTGGFFAGLFLFSLFDPVPPAQPDPIDV